MSGWWALQDLNLGPTDYESAALTAELRARRRVTAPCYIKMQDFGDSFHEQSLAELIIGICVVCMVHSGRAR